MTNEQLKQQLYLLQSGSMQAFDSIYSSLSTPLFAIILRITQNRPIAEDVLQDVFIKLYKNTSALCEMNNPRAYIFQMAHNMAIDTAKKNSLCQSLEELEDVPHKSNEDIPLKLDLEAAMSQLSQDERSIVTLHLNAGLKFREIAEFCSMPTGTVLWKYNKAIKKLRTILNGGTL